jgi:hypothetical protein
MASFVGGGFQLTPQGGLDGPSITFDENFVWQNNFFHHDTSRPQEQGKLDGNYFFNSGNLSHDLKFGVGYRKAQLESQSLFPGNGTRYDFYSPFGLFGLSRDYVNDSDSKYQSLYVQDTMTVGNLTANVGLRFDKQTGTVYSVDIPAVAGFETYDDGTPWLPAATTQQFDQGFDWTDVTPRLGITYALGAERKTLLRASYARFAEQLRQTYSLQEFTGFAAYSYFYYDDRNGDGFVTRDELLDQNGDGLITKADEIFNNEYDPAALTQPNLTDPNFSAPVTDEVILGIEHALLPEFVVGANLTFRKQSNIAEFERLVIDPTGTAGCLRVTADGCVRQHQRSDYVLADNLMADGGGPGFDPGSVTVPFYQFRDGLIDPGGSYETNGDREQDYKGVSIFFNKRLSNRWMLRGNFTFQDWTWNIPASENEDPNLYLGGARDDGGPVLQGSGTGSGSKGGIYINAGWSYSLTGMYQIAPDRKWGFNVSAAINGREGYALPFFRRPSSAAENLVGSLSLQATDNADDYQYDDIHIVDLRVEKEFSLKDSRFTVGVELFNAFNESTVLQRQHRLGLGSTDFVREIVSPQVFRLGVRFAFN